VRPLSSIAKDRDMIAWWTSSALLCALLFLLSAYVFNGKVATSLLLRAACTPLRPAPCYTLHFAPLPHPPPFTLSFAPWPQYWTPKKKGTEVLEGKTRSPEVRALPRLPRVPLYTLHQDFSRTTINVGSPPILLQVPLQLQVTGTGRTTMVDASPTMTAARLSRVIEKQTGVPRGSFALYHASKPMCGTLEESGVASGSTVELKFRGRGGGPVATSSLEVTTTGGGTSEAAAAPVRSRPTPHAPLGT